MNTCKHLIIHDKSEIISIPKISPTYKKEYNSGKQYSLKENLFDPSKSSPPNFFMTKLHNRMTIYNAPIKLDNRDNE
jgi:hypothetical protein